MISFIDNINNYNSQFNKCDAVSRSMKREHAGEGHLGEKHLGEECLRERKRAVQLLTSKAAVGVHEVIQILIAQYEHGAVAHWMVMMYGATFGTS